MIRVNVTNEMIQIAINHVYLNVNESTNRANITIGADWENMCRAIVSEYLIENINTIKANGIEEMLSNTKNLLDYEGRLFDYEILDYAHILANKNKNSVKQLPEQVSKAQTTKSEQVCMYDWSWADRPF